MKKQLAAKAGRMRLHVLGASALMLLLAGCGDHPPKDDDEDKPAPPAAITLVAGDATASGSADGTGSAARFSGPSGIAIDAAGNLYVADTGNETIRKITPAGVVTTLAGSAGSADKVVNATGSAARFSDPVALAIGPNNELYVGDGRLVRRVGTAGQVDTFAEIRLGSNVDGRSQALADVAGIAVDARGDLIVANGHSVRRIAPNGALTMLQGEETLRDTFGTRVFVQRGVAVDPGNNNVYVKSNGAIERTNGNSVVTQNVLIPWVGAPAQRGFADGTGAAARFEEVVAMTVGPQGNVYAADTVNNLIRRITPAGDVSTVAGKLKATTLTIGALPGSFPNLRGLATDGKGNFYVTSGNAIVRIKLP